jgi:hypothetical protein
MVLVPLPFVAEVIVIQLALLTACQAQLAGAFTINDEPPPFDRKTLSGDSEETQLPPVAADCETLKETPAIVSEPDRATGSVFGATE